MKNRFLQLAAGLGLLLSVSACEKDETKVTLSQSAVPMLTASATTATLTSATAANPAVTYTWTKADFGFQSATTYVLQFAKKGTNFAKTQDINVGAVTTKTFTGEELNGVYNALDCNVATVATPLEVRIKASVSDQISSNSAVSNLTASPYQAQTLPKDIWAIIGSATSGGWDKDTPMTYDFCTQKWTVTLVMTDAKFKFRANGTWILNYGDDAADTKLEPNGADIQTPSGAGTYVVVLDVNAKPKPTFTITKK